MSSSPTTWTGRPFAAASLRALTWVLPISASVVASAALSRTIPRPSGLVEVIVWWIGIGVVSVAVLLVVDRVARRLLPLAALLRLTLVFPDDAPSRYRAAFQSASIEQLHSQLDRLASKAEGGVLRRKDANEFAITILQLASRLDAHDPLTRGHSDRVRAYSRVLGDELGLSETELDRLQWAGFLHDVGKLEVPREIISKPGALDETERAQIQTHPAAGSKLVAPMAGWLGDWSLAVGEHHERWDGAGYPDGLAGTDISLAARIVAVADVFDVITSARSYKKPLSAEFARAEIAAHAGKQFDPVVVRALLSASLGRLRWIMGPLSWFAQIPILASVSVTPVTATVASAVVAVSVAGAVGALTSEASWAEPLPATASALEARESAATSDEPVPTATPATTVPSPVPPATEATLAVATPAPLVPTKTVVPIVAPTTRPSVPTTTPVAVMTAVPSTPSPTPAAAVASPAVSPSPTLAPSPTPSPAPIIAAAPADTMWEIPADDGTYTYPVASAGSVTFEFDDGDLKVLDVEASSGWSASIREEDGSEIRVEFESDDWEVRFEVDRQDSILEITAKFHSSDD